MGASGPSAASIADSSPALANRPAPQFSTDQRACRGRVAPRGCSGRRSDYNKVPAARQSGTVGGGGNRLTFAPLCAKGRNNRGGPYRGARSAQAKQSAGRHVLSAMGRYLLVVLGLLAWGTPASRAEDLERGKSGPAIFAADCAACHRSAQGLAYGISPPELMDLLRQHYTTGPGPANQVATYLLSVVGNGRRPKEKPLTEPSGSGPAGDQANKRRREETEPVGPRPPGEIRSNEAAVGEPRGAAGDRAGGRASNRSKKPGQPATAARGSEYEAARPP